MVNITKYTRNQELTNREKEARIKSWNVPNSGLHTINYHNSNPKLRSLFQLFFPQFLQRPNKKSDFSGGNKKTNQRKTTILPETKFFFKI